jgi:hypothetical protein
MNRRTFATRLVAAAAGLVGFFKAKPAEACIDTDYQAYLARLANKPDWLTWPDGYVGMKPERVRLNQLPSVMDVVAVRLTEISNSRDMIVNLDCVDGTSIEVFCVGNVRNATHEDTHTVTGKPYPVYSIVADKV